MKQAELIQLVDSLTQGEKKYFSTRNGHPSKGKGYKYLDLYEKIEAGLRKGKSYAEIENSLKSLPGAVSRQKNYLFENILEALTAYNRDNSMRARINRHLHEAELLERKGLVDLAFKKTKKAERLGRETERFLSLPGVLSTQRRLLLSKGNLLADKEEISHLIMQENECIDRFLQVQEIQKTYFESYTHWLNPGAGPDPHPIESVLKKWTHLVEAPDSPVMIRLAYHSMLGNIYQRQKDNQSALVHWRALLEAFEKMPELLKVENGFAYAAAIHNYLNSVIPEGDEEAFWKEFERLRSQQVIDQRAQENVSLNRLSVTMQRWISTRDLTEFAAMESTFQGLLQNFAEVERNREKYCLLRLYLGNLHFMSGNAQAALKELNQIYAFPAKKIPTELYINARLMRLICFVVRGAYDLCESEAVSIRRYCRKVKRRDPLEWWLLGQTEKLVEAYATRSPKLFAILHEDLIQTMEGESGMVLYGGFDLGTWLAEQR